MMVVTALVQGETVTERPMSDDDALPPVQDNNPVDEETKLKMAKQKAYNDRIIRIFDEDYWKDYFEK